MYACKIEEGDYKRNKFVELNNGGYKDESLRNNNTNARQKIQLHSRQSFFLRKTDSRQPIFS